MKNKLILFLVIAFASLFANRAQAQVVIIANPSVKASAVTKSEIADVFTGAASSLRDGSRVTPVLLKPGAAQTAFLGEFIGKADPAFRAGWKSLVFSGQGAMPKAFDSEAALIDYVASTPGAIGYISESVPHSKVKTLMVR